MEHSQNEELTEQENTVLKELEGFKIRFHEHMEDDFNTADAISIIFELAKFANTYAKEGASKPFIEAVLGLFNNLTDILGLIYDRSGNKEDSLSDKEIKG